MRIELEAGAVRLKANQTLRLRDSAGSTVCAVEGSVWITEENQAEDIVLDPGGCHRLSRPGLAIVHAPLGEADITVS
jgi:hypothetical protein